MAMEPADDLNRFVTAQAPVFDDVLRELRAGRKRTHWMWFVFPQLRGLGRSAASAFYGIASLAEARAYLDHPVLGPRLVACTGSVLELRQPADRVFGSPDDLKFRSCMTLFERVGAGDAPVFARAITQSCGGVRDRDTLKMLGWYDESEMEQP